MYIKQIIIQGFKSYKDQVVIEPFSPRHNVIVGRNGSGKSNFFWAIRFVLGDAYTTMTREERQSLLHEGSGPATISAYVEIIFDNSDNRFPTNKEEVVLRRTIGLKKDEYSLDKKSVTKADVMNLLEAAGFSRSNPYYIVPQGRITALCNSKDPERLALLKEVAGTRVYEERRIESLKIMEETDIKRTKIEELLEYIEERLAELEEEKEELREFQNKDRERRCIEYTIYNKEMDEVMATLDELEEERRVNHSSSEEALALVAHREKEINALEQEIRALQNTKELLTVEKQRTETDLQEELKSKANLEILVRELEEAVLHGSELRERLDSEREELQRRILEKETELNTQVIPQYEQLVTDERNLNESFNEKRVRREALFAKQGRSSQFKNRGERDAWLKKQIKSVTEALTAQTGQSTDLESEITTTRSRLEELSTDITNIRERLETRADGMESVETQLETLNSRRNELEERKKDLWRQEMKSSQEIELLKDNLKKWDRNLMNTMDRNMSLALQSVKKITEKYKIAGVHGPLYELFQVDDKYRAAVEVIAGNSLFHIVVDTDDIADKVLEYMKRDREPGRITFMPLNRLKPESVTYPDANDALPMMKKLRYEKEFEVAFKQVFSKAIICPNLHIASGYARSHYMTAVTLDGDRADRKGALTGGYHDHRHSRLECIKTLRQLNHQLSEQEGIYRTTQDETNRIQQEIVSIRDKLSSLTAQSKKSDSSKAMLTMELRSRTQEQQRLTHGLEKKEKSLRKLDAEIKELQAKVSSYETEMGTEMRSSLTKQEQIELDNLTHELEELKKRIVAASELRAECEAKKNVLEIELGTNLKRRLEEISTKLSGLLSASSSTAENDDGTAGNAAGSTGSAARRLEKCQKECKRVESKIIGMTKRSKDIEEELEDCFGEIREKSSALDKSKTDKSKQQRVIDRQQQDSERYLSRRNVTLKRKEEITNQIRELGVLPEEAFDKYRDRSSKQLMDRLKKVQDALKKFGHVNKKAFEQYNSFTNQRDQLLKRKEELDTSAKSIQDLVRVLDQRKDEAIQRTFKQVATYFEEVFEKLVPAGRGKLIMLRRTDEVEEENTETADNETEKSKTGIENYTGIAIKVSFNSKTDEGLLMQQLSGGQKSLVALAMIFAIQKCDPAPFYLFDEVDANLDPAYRTAVAAMIHELSQKAQFVTTTFRPELCAHANKFYGVTFTNKVSNIQVITQADAINFVEHEMPH